MKSPLIVLASAFALPLGYSTAMAGDVGSESFRALNGLSGADGATVVALTNDQLSAVEGGGIIFQRARARGGDGGAGGAGGIGVNVGVNALNCVVANCGGSGNQNQNAGNGGNGGNGGGALAINK